MNIDAQALSEVDVIIGMMPSDDKIKIPLAFKNFIKTKKDKDYVPDIKKDIQKQLKQN